MLFYNRRYYDYGGAERVEEIIYEVVVYFINWNLFGAGYLSRVVISMRRIFL